MMLILKFFLYYCCLFKKYIFLLFIIAQQFKMAMKSVIFDPILQTLYRDYGQKVVR